MLIVLLLVGRLVETLCRHRGLKALDALALPDNNIAVWQEGAWLTLPVAEVKTGMRVKLAPGERVALDGTLETPACRAEGICWLSLYRRYPLRDAGKRWGW